MWYWPNAIKVMKKAKIRNRYNQVPHLTRDSMWESDKNTRKHNTQESIDVSLICLHANKGADQPAHRHRLVSVLLHSFSWKHNSYMIAYMQTLNVLAYLCSWTGWHEPKLEKKHQLDNTCRNTCYAWMSKILACHWVLIWRSNLVYWVRSWHKQGCSFLMM